MKRGKKLKKLLKVCVCFLLIITMIPLYPVNVVAAEHTIEFLSTEYGTGWGFTDTHPFGIDTGCLGVNISPTYSRNGWTFESYSNGTPAAAGATLGYGDGTNLYECISLTTELNDFSKLEVDDFRIKYKDYINFKDISLSAWDGCNATALKVSGWRDGTKVTGDISVIYPATYDRNLFSLNFSNVDEIRIVSVNGDTIEAYIEAFTYYDITDTVAPTVGNTGIIETSNITNNTIDLAWTKAADDVSTPGNLQYKVVCSTSNNLSDIATIETNGTTVMDWTADIASMQATGLSQGTTYYFNVIVKDESGKKSIYTTKSEATTAPNTAPTLTSVNPQLAVISEDDTSNGGQDIASIVGATITDPDASAEEGIAIISVMDQNGAWEYSINGGTDWVAVAAVSGASALLLQSDDKVRFVPDGKNSTTGVITYRAWDRTSGSHGVKVSAVSNGGSTPFSTSTDDAAILVTGVNDAPTLDVATPTLTSITEDDATNAGDFVSAIVGATIHDVDSGAVQGMAITSTAVGSGSGIWQYSTDAGTSWLSIGAVSNASALLLELDDKIRFIPDTQNLAAASISYRAWDTTSGGAGDKVDTTMNGSSTAFSTGTNTASISATGVNDAPVLDTAPSPTFNTITADQTSNSGDDVATLVGSSISDVDSGAVEGIAITGLTSGNGVWGYSTDGSTWTSIGSVSVVSALLLRSTDKVRFTPNGQDATTATINYCAWDRTAGTAGDKVDTSMKGGITAFSTATETASITVQAMNYAPVLTLQTPNLTPINEDAITNGGQLVSAIVGSSISDVDAGASVGIAITSQVSGNGTWQYSINGGTDWTDISAVTGATSLLLHADDRVRFVPNGQNSTTGSFTYRAWDRTSESHGTLVDTTTNGNPTAFSTATDTASITVIGINDAPTLSADSPTLTGLTEHDTSNVGHLISSIVGATISDVDTGALQGIAITSIASGNGTWQYSTDNGGTWTAIGSVAGDSALLLRSTDKVRFVPDGQHSTTGAISYKAWDRVTGSEGQKADTTTAGGITAFSTATNTATITVIETIPPTLVSAERINNTQISVTLSENCQDILKLNNGGFTVEETGNAGTTYAVSAITQGVTASYVVLTVADMAISAKEGVTVCYTSGGNGTIKDSANNLMATNNTGVVVTQWDTTAPTMGTATLSADNSYIDITFNEGIYGANDGVSGLVAAKLALLFTQNAGTAVNVAISSIKKPDHIMEGSASALTGGESEIRVFLTVTGTPNGAESIEIRPANGTAIYDKAGNTVLVSESTGTKLLKDKLPPSISTLSPLDDATMVDRNANLVLTLSKNVIVGTGNITIKKNADNSIVETIDVTNGQVTGSGSNTITINPTNDLEAFTEYSVQIDATALTDSIGNVFAGIADTTSWSFTTKALSANADLSAFALSSGSVSPAFDAQTITYTLSVANGVSSIAVTPTTAQSGATVKVNSVVVTSGQASGSIDLNIGSNTITVEVKAEDGVASKTYTVTVTRAPMPTPTPIPTPVPTPIPVPTPTITPGSKTEEITVDVTNGTSDDAVSSITIERITQADGTKKDTVTYAEEKAKQTIQKLKQEGKDVARIVVPDAENQVSETKVNIPSNTLELIADGKINLEIHTEYARISIPNESLQTAKNTMQDDLYFQLVPVKKEEEAREITERAKKEAMFQLVMNDDSVSSVGSPMKIHTNLPSSKADIILPLNNKDIPTDAKQRQAFLSKLAVFIEHSDGTKELVRGEIVTYAPGVVGIKFTITKFSIFTIVKADSLAKSNACKLIKVKSPAKATINKAAITATVKRDIETVKVDVTISKKATWKLYSDKACKKVIKSKKMSLIVGSNKAYIKVTAEDGKSSKVYTINVTRKAKSVIIATKSRYNDAYAGQVLAKKVGGEVVKMGKTAKEAQRVANYVTKNFTTKDTIYILGLNKAIKKDVEIRLKQKGYKNIVRIGGQNKYETASKIAQKLNPKKRTKVVLVNGSKMPKDGTNISKACAKYGYSILYVKANSLTDSTIDALKDIKPYQIYLVGDKKQISDRVIKELKRELKIKSTNIKRISSSKGIIK